MYYVVIRRPRVQLRREIETVKHGIKSKKDSPAALLPYLHRICSQNEAVNSGDVRMGSELPCIQIANTCQQT